MGLVDLEVEGGEEGKWNTVRSKGVGARTKLS